MEGWERCKITDIVHPLTTVNPRKDPQIPFEYIDVSSVSRSTHKVHETTKLLGADAPSRARRKVHAGDVLFATIRPTLQRITIIPDHLQGAICSTGYYVLRPRDQVLSSFLFYYLFSEAFSSEMEELQRGASYPAVSDRDVKEHLMLLPPLPEQERIVAILDEAFAAIETATAHTEKNLLNARELFESQLQALLNPGDAVMEGWENTKLEEILEVQSGFAFRSKDYSEDGHFLIRIGNVQDREISLNKPKFVRLDKSTQRFELNAGDWLTSLTGNIGRVAIIKKSHLPAALNQRVARLSLIKNNPVHEGFVFYFLTSDHFKSELCDSGHGTAQKNVSPKAIGNIALLLPPLPEQERIVAMLDKASEKSQHLCDSYDLKLEHFANLKQSLLQKAFTGELTSDKKAADRTLSEAGL